MRGEAHRRDAKSAEEEEERYKGDSRSHRGMNAAAFGMTA